MRDMEERGVGEESEESDVIVVSDGECVCVRERERERECFHTRSILFSQNLKKSNRVLK